MDPSPALTPRHQQQHEQRQPHAVRFRAGKLVREAGTSTVKPDLRQGVVTVAEGDDELLHFYWKDVASDVTEDDYILFPDDAVLERVPLANQRVFVLLFKSSCERILFWMQEPKADQDDEILARINALINGLLTADEVSVPISNMTQDQSVAAINTRQNTSHSSAAVPSNFAPSGPVSDQQLQQLRNILSGIQVLPGTGAEPEPLNLSRVVTPQVVVPLLDDPKVCEALFPHLPDSAPRSRQEIEDIVRSPQFQQALDSLTTALQTGALGPLVQQLGLDPSAANGVEAFLRSIERRVEEENEEMDQI